MTQPNSRTFRDSVGLTWEVHLVEPVLLSQRADSWLDKLSPQAASANHERRRPWLVFESSEGEKRRLVPIPDDWTTCTDFVLERWCMKAHPVPPALARRATD
jgi:hypothetical protein